MDASDEAVDVSGARRAIYLDNAATAWPRPPAVADAVADAIRGEFATPGRGAHVFARNAGGIVERARTGLARLINAEAPERIVFTSGATDGLNLAIRGVVEAQREERGGGAGCVDVVTTVIEHNAVLRPLRMLEERGEARVTVVECDEESFVDAEAFVGTAPEGCGLAVVSHASNVTGAMQDVAGIARRLRERRPECLLVVDAAQTVGLADVDVRAMGAD
ncbi:MAG: aminotransferase class V-fold PLP-dependent enzyme, partial [Planctomycetota bacterium]|nr:aminotransferase class V-fold PLP-dependent enzyme [Planctomycetota bacterium]